MKHEPCADAQNDDPQHHDDRVYGQTEEPCEELQAHLTAQEPITRGCETRDLAPRETERLHHLLCCVILTAYSQDARHLLLHRDAATLGLGAHQPVDEAHDRRRHKSDRCQHGVKHD